jgi:thiol-disulfide isomerase/thioredoxin
MGMPKLSAQASLTALGTLFLAVAMPPLHGAKEPAPAELTLRDARGRKVRLHDYRGKLVVLNFWATWCKPCNEEMPLLVEADKAYGSRGVLFLGASLDDDKSKRLVPVFLNKYQISFPIWYDATLGDMEKLQMGSAVPATAFLDQDGRILMRIQGQMRQEELKERLEWLTGDRTGPAPQPLVTHLEK